MKVSELLERRRRNWQELEHLANLVQAGSSKLPPAEINRFGALYRAACADLALAYAYQLPQNTVQYLHRLVGRAHNQLYRSRRFQPAQWLHLLLDHVPKQVFNDRCVQTMFCVFWGLFILAAWLAYSKTAWPDFAEQVLSQASIDQLQEMYRDKIDGRSGDIDTTMAGFYVRHNTSIGLQCFTWGLLVVPGMLVTVFNAISLGASFGYMARPDVPEGANFFEFVTAHGPFELTAIVLSAGAGLRLGLSWMMPKGLSRGAALVKAGRQTMPVMGTAMVLFFLAALIEGFLSPSAAPYWVKVLAAIVSSSLLAFYFIVLGFPRGLTIPGGR